MRQGLKSLRRWTPGSEKKTNAAAVTVYSGCELFLIMKTNSKKVNMRRFTILFKDFFAFGVGCPLYTWYFLHYNTMILQRIRIIVGEAGFEPESSMLYKSGAIPLSHHTSILHIVTGAHLNMLTYIFVLFSPVDFFVWQFGRSSIVGWLYQYNYNLKTSRLFYLPTIEIRHQEFILPF